MVGEETLGSSFVVMVLSEGDLVLYLPGFLNYLSRGTALEDGGGKVFQG